MKPTFPIVFAFLLMTAAVILSVTREAQEPEIESAFSSVQVSGHSSAERRLGRSAASHRSPQSQPDLKTWASALSDEELKRLTLEMIESYQQGSTSRRAIEKLTALTMEWGRRDIDGFLLEVSPLKDLQENPNKKGIYFFPEPKSSALANSLIAAALVGLAEEDPANAWKRLKKNQQQIFWHSSSASQNLSLAEEAIFRSWGKTDPLEAWSTLQPNNHPSTSAIRGLLASIKDRGLSDQIMAWAHKTYTESPYQLLSSDLNPSHPAGGNTQIQGGSSTIHIIDSGDIINENLLERSFILSTSVTIPNPDQILLAAALGLAEHSPKEALEWIQQHDDPFDSNKRLISERFLSHWYERQPLDSISGTTNENPWYDRSGYHHATADGLFHHEPEAVIEVFNRIDDSTDRFTAFFDWLHKTPQNAQSQPWPLIEGLPQTLPPEEALQRIEQNLSHLNLLSAQESLIRQFIENPKNNASIPTLTETGQSK